MKINKKEQTVIKEAIEHYLNCMQIRWWPDGHEDEIKKDVKHKHICYKLLKRWGYK